MSDQFPPGNEGRVAPVTITLTGDHAQALTILAQSCSPTELVEQLLVAYLEDDQGPGWGWSEQTAIESFVHGKKT